ncbi:T9SS type A sorting domain-containing protein, partial [Porphyromonas macacae]
KHPPTGIYFVAEISSNSYKGEINSGESVEYTPIFTGNRDVQPFLGYEGVMVIACMKRVGLGSLAEGSKTYGNIEVPVRFVRNTDNNQVVPMLINGVFPNPTIAQCTVSSETEIASVDLFTLSGVKVRSYAGNGTAVLTINVADLENGTYLVGVRSTDGKLQSHRLIVQH